MYEPGQEFSQRKHAVQETVRRRAIERRLGLAFALAIAVLVANAAVSMRATRVLISNERGVAQALEVLNHLETTLSLMSDAETGQRGYLITGTEEYLATYDSALRRMSGEIGHLQSVTASQPRQGERLALLQGSIARKLDELRGTIAARKDSGFAAAQRRVLSGLGIQEMDEIRRIVAAMEDEENGLLAQHAAQSGASARTAVRTFLISNLIAVVFLIVGFVLVFRDITDRDRVERERAGLLEREKTARAEAEAASRAKDGFLATVSHELRAPLNAILGWTHLLGLKTLDGDSTRRAIETIERNARAQARLIDDLLDVSSIMSGKLRLHPEPVNLVSIIEAALEAVRPAADAKSIELSSQFDPGGGGVMGDPTRLQQVVWNLLTNAVKFTDRGGRIQVTLERADSQAQVTFSDSGRGIDAEFLPHLFERFQQADSSDTRRHGGMGLGLSIVRNLVEMHGGTIEARSPGPGRGASFIVRLPLRAVRADTRTIQLTDGDRRMRSPALAKLEGATVLVVDDESGAREVIAAVLNQYGAATTTVASAAEAMIALQQLRPDVLVSDISMPEQNGYELMATVRKMRPEDGGSVPAVALTAYARSEDRLRALAAGFQAHVPKPVEPSELALVVASLVDRVKVA